MKKKRNNHHADPRQRHGNGVPCTVADPTCGPGVLVLSDGACGSASRSEQPIRERPQDIKSAIQRIREAGHSTPDKLRRIESDMKVLAACLSDTRSRRGCPEKMTVSDIPCDPRELRPLLARIKWSRFWKTKRRWYAIRSSLNSILRETGWVDERASDSVELVGQWAAARDAITSRRRQRAFFNFAQFVIAKGRTPATVTEEDLEEYRQMRLTRTIDASAESGIRALRCIWNELELRVKGWTGHRLNRPINPRLYADPKELDPDFLCSIDGYLSRLANPNPFDTEVGRRRSPSTIKCLRGIFLRMASVLITEGRPANTITSIRDVLTPAAVRAVLMDQYVRLGNNQGWPPGAAAIASYISTAAKLCRSLPEDERSATLELCKIVKSPPSGMTARNRARLAEFDDPALLRRLFELPNRCFEVAEELFKKDRKVRAAQYYQKGIALAIQFCKPLRRLELARLHIDDHFRFNKKGELNYFCIPGTYEGVRSKGGNDIEGFLTPDVSAHLKIFIAKYRPILNKHGTGFLFPGKYEGRINEESLGNAIKKLVEEHLATDYSVHFIRNLVAKMIFDADPNNGPIAQRMLDHSSLKITQKAYASLRTRAAHNQYVGILERALGGNEP